MTNNRTVRCPGCRRPSPAGPIYCEDEDCAAVLYPQRAVCRECSGVIPVNANFCPECGAFNREDGTRAARPGGPGRRALEEMRRTLGRITGRRTP